MSRLLRCDVEWTDDGVGCEGGVIPLLGPEPLIWRRAVSVEETHETVWTSSLVAAEIIRMRQGGGEALVELGAGVGVVARAAKNAKRFVSVTMSDKTLGHCLDVNMQAYANVRFVPLNWAHVDEKALADLLLNSMAVEKTLLIVSDCVYDDDVSLLLFQLLERVFESLRGHCECILVFEKRIVWRAGDDAPSAPHAEFFLDLVHHSGAWRVEDIDLSSVDHVLPYVRRPEITAMRLLSTRH